MPQLNGKVILITGGNSGLGKAAVMEFCRHQPVQVWLATRSLDKTQAAADEIKQQLPHAPIKMLEVDLSSFDSPENAAFSIDVQLRPDRYLNSERGCYGHASSPDCGWL